MAVRNGCPSDLTGEQLERIGLLVGPSGRGDRQLPLYPLVLNQWYYANLFRKRKLNTNSYMRVIFKAIFGVIVNCCSLRMLPVPKDSLTEHHQ